MDRKTLQIVEDPYGSKKFKCMFKNMSGMTLQEKWRISMTPKGISIISVYNKHHLTVDDGSPWWKAIALPEES